MLDRLVAHWVYGGGLAGLLLLLIAPLVMPAMGAAAPVYLALPIYMLHQFEEHDDDRFRHFVNATVAKGRHGLTLADVFLVNVPLVWGINALALWLGTRVSPGWGLIATGLILVNAVVHIAPAIARRSYNPGLYSAILLFLPLGLWQLARLAPLASALQLGVGLVVALAIHAAIVIRALQPLPAAKG